MKTKLEICNLALAYIGQGRTISSFASDNTNEAASLRLVYDNVLDRMLRGFKWPFATKFADLEYAHDGYGADLTLDRFDATTSYSEVSGSEVEVLLTALDTTEHLHVDCTISTAISDITSGYITVTLQGGPSGDNTAHTAIQTIGYFAYDAPVGERITAYVPSSSLTYAAYSLKFVASSGETPTGGVFNAFIAERSGSPVDEWGYAYEYPSDCLYITRIGGASRNDVYDVRVPFKRIHRKKITDLSGTNYTIEQQVLCDEVDLCAEYITNECIASGESTDYVFPEDFATAFAYALAIDIYPRMSSGDSGTFLQNLAGQYQVALSRAQANAANEMGMDIPRESEYVRARE